MMDQAQRVYSNFRKTPDGRYVVVRPMTWDIGKKSSNFTITIPAGFSFDSSVPWPLWWFWSPDDPFFLWAAAVHDWLLENEFRPAMAAGEWHDAAKSVRAPAWRRIPAFMLVALWTMARETTRTKKPTVG